MSCKKKLVLKTKNKTETNCHQLLPIVIRIELLIPSLLRPPEEPTLL